MGVITNLIRMGQEKKARDQENQMRAFELASHSDDPQLAQWGIKSLVDMGQKSATDPETKKHLPVIGQMATLLHGLKALNPVPGAPKLPDGKAPAYSPERAQAEQTRQAGVKQGQDVARQTALEEARNKIELKQQQALAEQQERQRLLHEENERQRRTKEGTEAGLTGDALKRYGLEGKFPTRFGEEPTLSPGARHKVEIETPDGKKLILYEDKSGLYNVGGEKITVPTGSRYATPAEKQTDVDKVANHLLLSGKVSSKTEAQQRAASLLAEVDMAKAKAASAGGGGSAMTPQELQALAQWQIATGQVPAFGLGANNPNRTAYQKVLAGELSGGGAGVGGALEERAGFRGGQATLTKLMQAKGNIGAFERNARANIERAVALSSQVGRTGARLANEYLQWAQGELTDYPQLAAFRVAVDTAAKDYALVTTTATMGGVSTDSARAGAAKLFNDAMAEGSLKGAADSMFADMKNRIDGLDTQIDETRKGIRGGAPVGSGGTPMTGAPSQAKPTKRFNPQTGKVEDIKQ